MGAKKNAKTLHQQTLSKRATGRQWVRKTETKWHVLLEGVQQFNLVDRSDLLGTNMQQIDHRLIDWTAWEAP